MYVFRNILYFLVALCLEITVEYSMHQLDTPTHPVGEYRFKVIEVHLLML